MCSDNHRVKSAFKVHTILPTNPTSKMPNCFSLTKLYFSQSNFTPTKEVLQLRRKCLRKVMSKNFTNRQFGRKKSKIYLRFLLSEEINQVT